MMRATEGLVSPVADSFAPRPVATRVTELVGPVGLVDGMLNQSGVWGQGILDAVQAELTRRHPRAHPERVARPQLGSSPAEIWAATMADRYAALVVAAGD